MIYRIDRLAKTIIGALLLVNAASTIAQDGTIYSLYAPDEWC